MDYPVRQPCFAMKFCRQLSKRAAALKIGADGCWLLTVIAMQEDANHYESPAIYYGLALADRCGWHRNKLQRVRERCIKAGYLHHEPGPRGEASIYWVTLPKRKTADDEPVLQDAAPIAAPTAHAVQHQPGTDCSTNCAAAAAPLLPVPETAPAPKKRTAAFAAGYSPEFEEAWEAYRNTERGGQEKPASFRAWQKAIAAIRGRPGVENPHEWLLERIRAYAATADEFAPVMHRWLKKAKYDDDPRGPVVPRKFNGVLDFMGAGNGSN